MTNRDMDREAMEREGFTGQSVSEINIAYVGYRSADSLLQVEYQNGAIYNYQDVPFSVWQSCMGAQSKGLFIAQSMKGRFRYYRVNGD